MFFFLIDFDVEVPGYGKVTVDISYGGAFFAYMPVKQLGLDLSTTPTDRLRNAASLVTGKYKNIRSRK
jgi:proline racemase